MDDEQKAPNQIMVGSNLNRILTKLMEDNMVSLTALHRNTGIAIPTIKRLQTDSTANPTITTLLPIANFFGITINQLVGIESLPEKTKGYLENRTNWLKIPLISWKQAVNWQEANEHEIFEQFIFTDADAGKNPYALKVEEDDWVGFLKDSILIINTNLIPEHRDYAIIYKVGQDSPSLKQIIFDEDKIFLKSLSPYIPPTLFNENYKFLGVLIQVRKNIKT